MHAPRLVSLADCGPDIRDGDLLLFRRRGLAGRIIAAAGRSPYCHAGMVGRLFGEPWLFDVVEHAGGRALPLSVEVERSPGRIDWFESDPDGRWEEEFDRDRAVLTMAGFVGCKYGGWNLLRVALYHVALVRMFLRPDNKDNQGALGPPFCSHAVAAACRAAGVDAVPNLADRLTEPSDLARSLFFEYRATLIS